MPKKTGFTNELLPTLTQHIRFGDVGIGPDGERFIAVSIVSDGGSADTIMRYDDRASCKTPSGIWPRSLFARDGVVSGSLSWQSRSIWSIFSDATRVNPAAIAALA